MRKQTLIDAKAHAISCYPRESCGVVIIFKGKERYVPITNRSSDNAHFTLDPKEFAAAEDVGKVTGIVHSHPDEGARASEADLVSCENSQLPWHIIAVHQDAGETEPVVVDVNSFKPNGYEAPLIGREFSYGILDCYTLIQDWFARERGVVLPRIDSDDDGWWDRGEDLYMKNFKAFGFNQIGANDELEVGDVILMKVRAAGSPVIIDTNHAAIYLGDTRILHHLYGRLSSRDVYGGYWREITQLVVRYTGVVGGQ